MGHCNEVTPGSLHLLGLWLHVSPHRLHTSALSQSSALYPYTFNTPCGGMVHACEDPGHVSIGRQQLEFWRRRRASGGPVGVGRRAAASGDRQRCRGVGTSGHCIGVGRSLGHRGTVEHRRPRRGIGVKGGRSDDSIRKFAMAHWQYISEIGVKIECAGACAIDEGWPRAIAKVGVSTISTKTRALGRRKWKDTEGDARSGGSQVVIRGSEDDRRSGICQRLPQPPTAGLPPINIYADLSGFRGNNKDARQLGCTTAIEEALIPISACRCLYVAVPKRRGPDCPGPHLHRCKSCTADGREVERGLACDPGAPASPQTRVTRRRSRRRSSTRRISTDDGAPCGIRPASASEPPVLFSLASNLTHRLRAPRSTCADPDVDPDSQSQHLSPTGRRQSIHSLHESVRDADIYFVIVILLSRPSP
ncbi:hypothetical protein GGX14DRAFT_395884 [Mycena pura]|uniref:Uncharacterized protein n=1 Tax=Mycena pura TaxID=153505 RepID=A0AAD6Y947_9AGAR|nr:hypothetical protein GGX14DRAFT_395884 [Mycena pura]